MKKYVLSFLTVSVLSLSGCGYEVTQTHKAESVYVRMSSPEITLTDIRNAYSDGSVEIYDLNVLPTAYARAAPTPVPTPALNKRIPVRDRSVEIYDIGFVPMHTTSIPAAQLAPPSGAREDYSSPFHIIEDDSMLTDPFSDEVHTSVIVPPAQDQNEGDDGFQLMTGF